MADLKANLTASVTLLIAPPLNTLAVSELQHLKKKKNLVIVWSHLKPAGTLNARKGRESKDNIAISITLQDQHQKINSCDYSYHSPG
jgi:hypothetical protein